MILVESHCHNECCKTCATSDCSNVRVRKKGIYGDAGHVLQKLLERIIPEKDITLFLNELLDPLNWFTCLGILGYFRC